MSMATYPFFRVVVEAVGRQIRLRGQADAPAVLRAVAENYGDRSTVRRATQRVLQSVEAWGVLEKGEDGEYRPVEARAVSEGVTSWMLAAALWSARVPSLSLDTLESGTGLFPFDLSVVQAVGGGVEVMAQGGRRQVAVLPPAGPRSH